MDDRATVHGRVTAVSGEPLRKTRISLWSTNVEDSIAYVTLTGADGEYRIDDVAPGQYQLEAHHLGYVRQTYGGKADGWVGQGIPITVAPERALGGFDFVLMPQAVITGRVVDPEGDPLESVRVMLLREVKWDGGTQLAPTIQGVTDDRGEFRLAGIAPGLYLLSASHAEQMHHRHARRVSQGAEESYPNVYYPDVLDADEAQWIHVPMGTTLSDFELWMKRTRAFRVAGRVEIPEGVNRMSIFVHIRPKGPGVFITGGHHHGGENFEFDGIQPGAYVVSAQCNIECRSLHAFADVEVTDRDVSDVVLRFPTGMTITGSVRGDGAVGGVVVVLTAAGGTPGMQGSVAADGSFTLQDVPGGRYRVGVFHTPRGGYVKTVRYGGVEVPRGDFEIVEAAELELELAFDSGTVSGSAAPGAQVRLWRDGGVSYWRAADQDGRFEIDGVEPGEYFYGEGRTVTVAPNGRVEIEI
jgi:protocatechuate 3,4-dioxygenase beta subunit